MLLHIPNTYVYSMSGSHSSGKVALNIYIINASHLSIRREKIKAVVELITSYARQLDYGLILPKIINTYNPKDIEEKIEDYKTKVSHDHIGDDVLDTLFDVFSMEMFSNTEKHREAWKYISTCSESQDTLHLVIEDDTIIMPDNVGVLKDMLAYMKSNVNSTDWDILYLGFAQPNPEIKDPITLTDVSATFKVLPSKEAYFVNRNAASKMYKAWTDGKISARLRVQMSKYFFMNKGVGIKAVYPNRRVTIDGSKLGLFPCTIHGNNVLVLNGEYMQLFKMFQMSDDEVKSKDVLQEAKHLYNSVKHIKSPDISHVYGVILYKAGKLDESEMMLQQALIETRESQGLLNNRCDLCNNIVNVYQQLQRDIDTEAISKYDKSNTSIPLKM